MAEKRMYSTKITNSADFYSMPSSTQALYFHLCQESDDDGFNNQVSLAMFKSHATTSDLEILFNKRFVLGFDNGVIVIKHWRMHNYIRRDTYKPTAYQELLARLDVKDNGSYTVRDESVTKPLLTCNEPVSQIRLDKNRLDKNNIDAQFDAFWKAYPNKKSKQKAHQIFEKLNPNDALFEEIMNGLERAKNSLQWKKDNGQYIPHPTTWLNGRRWEDEYESNADEDRVSAIDF